jgi:aminopeptidase N
MIRKFGIFAVLLLAAFTTVYAFDPAPGSDSMGDEFYPLLGNGGYDVQHYRLNLDVDVEANIIDGVAIIEAKATQDLSSFNLDFEGFQIGLLLVDDQPAGYTRSEHELTIEPAQPLETGEDFTVSITYTGEPGEDYTSDAGPLYSLGWVAYNGGIFVASEPSGAARWFPANDHPLDKATFTFEITVPEPYVAAANGLLKETLSEGDVTTYIWQASDPMATYLATVNIDEFAVQTLKGPNGLPIRNYFPEEIAEDAEFDFSRQGEMIELFSRLFGPYPFEAYGAVVSGTSLPFALETQTLSLFGRNIVSGNRSGEEVIAHELAHQWFGNSVSVASWRDIWLNEGFASYGEHLWTEYLEGYPAMEQDMRNLYVIIDSGTDFAAGEFPPPGNPPPDNLFNGAVYLRGAWTLHALRLEVGSETFFRIVQTYYDRFKYSNASTEDFIAVAEEVSGRDLDSFFQAWLFDEELPDIPEVTTVLR